MPAAQNFQAGTRGKLFIAVVGSGPAESNVKVEGWTVDPKAATHKTTHSGSAGFVTREFGIEEASGTIKCTYDALAIPFIQTPALVAGQRIAARLYVGDDPVDANNDYWEFPVMIIVGTPMVSESEGMVTYTINWESSGTFTYPAGP